MNYSYKPLLENAGCVYVGTYLINLFNLSDERIRAVSEDEASHVVDKVNNSSLQITVGDEAKNVSVRVSYIPSNLGVDRGFIFYFVCKGCNRRARYLYITNHKVDALCRKCQCLVYKKQKESNNRIARLLNNPELLHSKLNSPRIKDQLLATEALFVQERLEEKAIKAVENGILKGL